MQWAVLLELTATMILQAALPLVPPSNTLTQGQRCASCVPTPVPAAPVHSHAKAASILRYTLMSQTSAMPSARPSKFTHTMATAIRSVLMVLISTLPTSTVKPATRFAPPVQQLPQTARPALIPFCSISPVPHNARPIFTARTIPACPALLP